MRFGSLEEIVAFAIEKEKQAVAFYKDLTRQEPFQGSREVFEGFAREELKHQNMLEDLTEEEALERTETQVPDLKRSDYLVDMEYEPGMPYVDILRLAAKREEKALALYETLVQTDFLAHHKKLFQILAQEEARHKLALEKMLDDVLAQSGD